MKQFILTFAIPIIVILPLFLIIVRVLFKKSILTKIGYVLIFVVIFSTLFTKAVSALQLPEILGVPIRLFIVLGAIFVLKSDIKVLQGLEKNIDELSNYNFSTPFAESYLKREDEFGNITKSMNRMREKLISIVSNIHSISQSVSQAGNRLSTVSVLMSERANEQATTTKEIASSIEMMTTTINSNIEKAEITGNISSKAVEETQNTNKILQKTIQSVSEISERIVIISEIADKTDLLSINASIEAARSGEAGKGFAVVAQEIRKLADKTKNASEVINDLSKSGRIISKTAEQQLIKLIPQIVQSAAHVNDIIAAGKEQQSSIGTINSSIQQLTNITYKNSSSAEEMSASAEELSAQAEQLEDLIAVFVIDS